MAAHIGTVTVALLARVGDHEPIEIGAIELPVTVTGTRGPHFDITVSPAVDPRAVAGAIAREVEA
jgi:hypothetical protein